MNNQTIYWLWIQQAIGYATTRLDRITARYSFAEDYYRAPFEEKMRTLESFYKDAEKLRDTSLDRAKKIIELCEDRGIDIVAYGDEGYPEKLRSIKSPPAVLYVRGNIKALHHDMSIALVGTRNATLTGCRSAFSIAFDLAKAGVCVVSGGAKGIDTHAHKGAVFADGMTVCVLGGGHECGYLRENDDLKSAIEKNGAVISEYPPDMTPSKYTFPQRNRIISGLSRGVAVIEAGTRSGALITVSTALEQGRDVFALPGEISNPYSLGTNDLIKDGAVPITNANDILAEYTGAFKKPEKDPYESNELVFDAYIAQMLSENETENKPVEMPIEKHIEKPVEMPIEKHIEKAVEMPVKKEKKPSKKPKKPKEAEEKPEEKKPEITAEIPDDISENAKMFLNALEDKEVHIDDIAQKTGLPITDVHAAATELEMEDLIEALEGRRFKRANL